MIGEIKILPDNNYTHCSDPLNLTSPAVCNAFTAAYPFDRQKVTRVIISTHIIMHSNL